MKHKLYNRLLSLALALGLVVGMLPGMTFAGAVDTTAPQSQAEQIAEPTEELEANDAPQAEPRAQTNQVTVQYVDTNGSEIQNNSSEQINYSDDQEINVEAYAKDIPNYTFNHAEVDGATIIAVRVKKSTGFFGNVSYNLQYKIDPEDWWQDEWNNWPNSWGTLFPLVLVYEKDAEPEPTPDSDVYITDTILTDGMLNANVNDELDGQVASYKWYRSETGSDNTWTEVVRTRVTGTEYNLNEDTKKLNAALDKYLISSKDDSIRYYYYIEAFDANGESLGWSEVYQVPYYDALQNGSFETPSANHWNNQLRNGTANLYWLTTAHDSQGRDIEIVRSTNENFWDGNIQKTFQQKVQEIYGPTAAADGVQFAELNAEAQGALYQDVLTVPGSTVYWSLAHAARQDSIPDSMKVVIAPADKVQNITTQTQLLNFIEQYPEYVQKPSGSNRDGTITSSTSDWTTYTGNYSVPSTQYVTRFFFVSLEGDTLGNLLDDISFSREVPKPEAGTGNLTVTKQIKGMDDIPEDYQVTVTVKASGESGRTHTFNVNSFASNGDGTWTASHTFTNLPVKFTDEKQYTVTEDVTGETEEYIFLSDESTTKMDVTVQEGENVDAILVNAYEKDTSDEYPVRFYLEGIKTHQVTENYTFTDEWAKLNADLIGGFANVTSTLYGGEDYPNLDGEAGYDSAVIGGSASGGIRGHANVETWLEKYKCAPNIDTHNIANVLDDLIKMYPQIANVPVTVVGDEEYTVSEIKNTLQTDPDAFQIVYTQVTKNHDAITEHFGGNGSVAGGQDSYHVHLSIRKNPGDLTVTKTFAGLEADQIPSEFAIQVKASNGTLIDTLSLNEATLKDDTYTWTLENLNEDIYTVTEINTDVDNKALNVAYTVTDSSDDTLESDNTTSAEVYVAGNETSSVAFTNTYTDAEGVLTITKVLENSQQATNGKPVFDFKITSQEEDGTVYYVHIDMNTDDHDKELTLPAGTYKVEELDSLNYEQIDVEGLDGNECVEVGGTDKTVTFTNTADNSNIPSDSGATQNNPSWGNGNVITWHKDDKITCNPEDPGKKPDSTEN